jgi:uncharacterized membrane protein
MAEVNVKVGMNNSAFSKGLDSMRSMAKSWAADVGKMFVGAFAVGQIMNSLSSLASELDRVGKLATRLGVLPSTIAKIGQAAELAGTDVETVVKILAKLTLQANKSASAFEAAGISASKFASASPEDQWIMLADAYQKAGNDAVKLAALQQLLGKQGLELITSLKGGPEALAQSMGQFSDAYNTTVRQVEAMNDAMTKFKKQSVSEFAQVFHAARQGWAMFKGFATGGIDGAVDELVKLQEEMDKMFVEAEKKRKAAAASAAAEAAKKEQEEEQDKVDKIALTIEEKLAQRALDRMETEAKILKLQEDQAEAMRQMEDMDLSALERAEAAKKALDLQEKIEDAEKKADQEADAAAAEEAKLKAEEARAQQAVADAEAKVAAEEDRQSLAAMTPAERAAELQKRQAALFAQSKAAEEDGDALGAAESRLAALQMADAIAAALAESMPDAIEEANEEAERGNSSVVSSSLAAIGGGGGSFVSGVDPQLTELKNQTRLLERIANSTTQTATQNGKELF